MRDFKITDAQVHALVGDGLHYGADTIPYLRCQACHTKFSVRLGTPMYDLKTPARRVDEVMTATSEGVDVSAASRIFKHDERTNQRWLARTAAHSQSLSVTHPGHGGEPCSATLAHQRVAPDAVTGCLTAGFTRLGSLASVWVVGKSLVHALLPYPEPAHRIRYPILIYPPGPRSRPTVISG